MSSSPLFQKARPDGSVYYFKSPIDGVQRLSYYQRGSPGALPAAALAYGKALRELGLPHALNPPSKLVTASLGGATFIAAHGMTDHAALLAAADRSLYEAKNGGRDRLVMSGQVVAWPEAKSA